MPAGHLCIHIESITTFYSSSSSIQQFLTALLFFSILLGFMSPHSIMPHDYSKRADNMSRSADSTGSSSRQQPSITDTSNMLPSSKSQGRSRFSDNNTKGPGPFANPYIHPHLEPRGQLDDGRVIKPTFSGNFPNPQPCSKVNTETDIVRHMKNLPGYLRPAEKPTNVQDRALNIGVLDWKRLQKWRDKEMLPKKCNAPAPSLHKKHGLVDLHVNVLPQVTLSNHTRNSSEWVKNVKDSQHSVIGTTTAGKLTEKMKLSNTYLELKNHEGKRVDRNLKTTLQTEGFSQYSATFPNSEQQDKSRHGDSIKPGPEPCADEPQDVCRRSFFKSHHLLESKKGSIDGNSIEKSHSCRHSSQELQPGNHADKFPHCFPSPDNVLSTQGMRSDVCAVDSQNDARRSSRMKNSSVDYSTSARTFEEMDYGSAEKAEAKSRPQSPNRRFSFNLGKIGRSFSFRESSTMAKDDSKYLDAKPGPISSGRISGIVDQNREKAHASLGWSSSFRKILNPVLKSKAAQSAQASQSNSVVPEPASAIKLHHDHTPNFQALVQLSFKNQVPCFRFVAGNSCDILTASIKDVPTKTNNKFSYSFYSVTEVKKKSASWIGHGSKEKRCCFDHTALCQMKISAASISGMVMEYVLYGVHDKGGDPEVLLNREIGAIIVEEPAALAYGSKESEECRHIESDPFAPVVDATEPGETEYRNTITVLLPGGDHGLPKEGAPSSLIERWKSGGVCDCGGWDMGCKLRVLMDQKEESVSSRSVRICSLIDRVDISKQEDGKGRKQQPIFRLAPFKDGYYSVNYDSSRISELEGFAICVAVLTSERLSDILDVNLLVLERKKSSVEGRPIAKYYSSPPTSPAGRI